MRLLLVLAALVLVALPAQGQDRFFQACVASAEMPEGIDAGAFCGCATQQATRAGAAPADLDRLADHVPAGGGALDVDALPDDLRPAAEAGMQAVLGCALQLGVAEAMQEAATAVAEGMTEAMSEMAGALSEGMAEAAAGAPAAAVDGEPAASAAVAETPPVMRNGIPPQLAARMAAAAPAALTAPDAAAPGQPTASAAAPAPTVTPDGTVAAAPTPRTDSASSGGVRTGSGRPAVQTAQSGKGAAIRILR